MVHRTRGKNPVGRVRIGNANNVSVFAFGKEEMGIPLVELTGDMESLRNLTVEQALLLGESLILAAQEAGDR